MSERFRFQTFPYVPCTDAEEAASSRQMRDNDVVLRDASIENVAVQEERTMGPDCVAKCSERLRDRRGAIE